MNWHLAKLVFAIHHRNNVFTTQCEEQLRLIEAKDKAKALIKVKMIGIQKENSFTKEDEVQVHWKFIDVIKLTTVENLTDDAELHSRIDEHDLIDQQITFAKYRGQILTEEFKQFNGQTAQI